LNEIVKDAKLYKLVNHNNFALQSIIQLALKNSQELERITATRKRNDLNFTTTKLDSLSIDCILEANGDNFFKVRNTSSDIIRNVSFQIVPTKNFSSYELLPIFYKVSKNTKSWHPGESRYFVKHAVDSSYKNSRGVKYIELFSRLPHAVLSSFRNGLKFNTAEEKYKSHMIEAK